MAATADDSSRTVQRRHSKRPSEAGDGRHHGARESGEFSDRQQAAESFEGTAGAAVSQTRCALVPELCACGSAMFASGQLSMTVLCYMQHKTVTDISSVEQHTRTAVSVISLFLKLQLETELPFCLI